MFHLFSKILKGINIIRLWPSVRPCVHPCIGHTFRFQKFLIILKCKYFFEKVLNVLNSFSFKGKTETLAVKGIYLGGQRETPW